MAKVLIADEHEAIRLGLREMLKGIPGIVVAAEVSDARQIMELVAAKKIEVVIMGLWFPAGSGLAVLRDLKRAHPGTKVLVYTAVSEDELGVRTIRVARMATC